VSGGTDVNPDQSFDLSVKNHDNGKYIRFEMQEVGEEKKNDPEAWTRSLLSDKLPKRGIEILGHRSWGTPVPYPP